MENFEKNNCARELDGNMEKSSDRLLSLLDYIGKNRSEIADESGISITAVSNYCNGARPIGKKLLSLLVNKYGVSSNWLLFGDGEPFRNIEPDNMSETFADACAALKHELADKDRMLADLERELSRLQRRILEAVKIVCREISLSPEQARMLKEAVIDPEEVLALTGPDQSHQSAVGEE
jgi:transcriptional regulator with XRE-family HTH domain